MVPALRDLAAVVVREDAVGVGGGAVIDPEVTPLVARADDASREFPAVHPAHHGGGLPGDVPPVKVRRRNERRRYVGRGDGRQWDVEVVVVREVARGEQLETGLVRVVEQVV